MILKAYRYRIYPTKKQQEFFGKHFGSVRFVYNHFLFLRSEAYKTEKKNISGFECKRRLIALKAQYPWLREINSQSLQQSVLDLEKAYRRFFKKLGGYPHFKKKHNRQSFTVPQNFKVEDDRLYIPKLNAGIKLKLDIPCSLLQGVIIVVSFICGRQGECKERPSLCMANTLSHSISS